MTERMRRGLVVVMATATGLAVANNYYAQPLLPSISRTLHIAPDEAGYIVTVAQVGYAVGLLLILPLGDLLERRRLVVTLCVLAALALTWMGASPSGSSLLSAAFFVGSFSVIAQVLVPFAASLASPGERGRVVGMVMSGLLIGILLARTVSGLLAETGSWRVVYFAAAAAMLIEAVVLRMRLPTWKERPGLRYPALVASVARIFMEEPLLRLRSCFGFFSFATFSVLWTTMAFLLSHRYHYSTAVIGLFGLLGAAGAAAATLAGRLSDQRRSVQTTAVTTALMSVAWLCLWAGKSSLFLFVIGVIALDIGVQGVHITNQGEIYRLRPEARSRLTSAYMITYFAGGAIGSAASATLYAREGWDDVCILGAAFAVASFVLWIATVVTPLRRVEALGSQELAPSMSRAGTPAEEGIG